MDETPSSRAKNRACPVFSAINVFLKGEFKEEYLVKCIGEECGAWSRQLEGCGWRSTR